MSEKWFEFHIPVPPGTADLVGHQLAELGCEGITVEERRLDTFTPPDPNELPDHDYILKAYFRPALEAEELRRLIKKSLEDLAPFAPGLIPVLPKLHRVSKEDWAESWKQHFPLFRIGRRLVVKPSWESYSLKTGEAVIELDPGMAFGTGTHGTTRLCLEALAALYEGGAPPQRVLDVGTGSGILSIAAAALGAGRVLACDIEEEARRTARENVARNGVARQVEVTELPLEELEGGFEIVLANIIAEELVRLGPELVRRLTAGGALVLSGILHEKEALVREGFNRFGLFGPEISRLEEWSCLCYRRN